MMRYPTHLLLPHARRNAEKTHAVSYSTVASAFRGVLLFHAVSNALNLRKKGVNEMGEFSLNCKEAKSENNPQLL